MDELKVFKLFVFLVLSADACFFWLINSVVDARDGFNDIVTQNVDLDKKLNLQLDELRAESMQ